MSDYEISQLTSLSAPASGDLLSAVDISDTTTPPAGSGGSNKKLTLSGLLAWLEANFSFAGLTSLATTHNTLDDGSGNATIAGTLTVDGALTADGVIAATAGTDTSGVATASAPSLTSGTAAQLNTTRDVMLYCNVKVASTFALSIGPTSTPADAIVASATAGVGLITVRVPKGWYVKATFTSADLVFTAVTC